MSIEFVRAAAGNQCHSHKSAHGLPNLHIDPPLFYTITTGA